MTSKEFRQAMYLQNEATELGWKITTNGDEFWVCATDRRPKYVVDNPIFRAQSGEEALAWMAGYSHADFYQKVEP